MANFQEYLENTSGIKMNKVYSEGMIGEGNGKVKITLFSDPNSGFDEQLEDTDYKYGQFQFERKKLKATEGKMAFVFIANNYAEMLHFLKELGEQSKEGGVENGTEKITVQFL